MSLAPETHPVACTENVFYFQRRRDWEGRHRGAGDHVLRVPSKEPHLAYIFSLPSMKFELADQSSFYKTRFPWAPVPQPQES